MALRAHPASNEGSLVSFRDHRGLRHARVPTLPVPPVHVFHGRDGAEGLREWLREVAEVTDMDLVLVGHVTAATYTTVAFYARIPDPSLEKGDTIPIGETYCREEITADAPFVLPDAEADAAFRDHPGYRVHGLRAYVGAPLRLGDGTVFGTLCAVDANPKPVPAAAAGRLEEIAHAVAEEISRRLHPTA